MQVLGSGEKSVWRREFTRMRNARVSRQAIPERRASVASDGVGVDAIAARAGMSVAHLRLPFPAVANGASLDQFVWERRLCEHAWLWSRGQNSMQQAAQWVGLRRSTHFAGALRPQFGVAPSRISQRHADVCSVRWLWAEVYWSIVSFCLTTTSL